MFVLGDREKKKRRACLKNVLIINHIQIFTEEPA